MGRAGQEIIDILEDIRLRALILPIDRESSSAIDSTTFLIEFVKERVCPFCGGFHVNRN